MIGVSRRSRWRWLHPAFAEEAYGILRDQVIGPSVKLRFEAHCDRTVIMKLAELNRFDDREVKPANTSPCIGRRSESGLRQCRLSALAEAIDNADQYGITLVSIRPTGIRCWRRGRPTPPRPGRSVAPRQVGRS